MALDVYAEWRLAEASSSFQTWLDQGAPSDDAQPDGWGGARIIIHHDHDGVCLSHD
jgi:hypothetical protein